MKYHLTGMMVKKAKNSGYVVYAMYSDDQDAEDYTFERIYACSTDGISELFESIPQAVYRKKIEKDDNILDVTDKIEDSDGDDEGADEIE